MTLNAVQILGLIAAAIIFWRSETIINLMGHTCRLPIRVAFWLLLVSSLATGAAILGGYLPALPILGLLCGVALLLASERRLKGILRLHSPSTLEKRRTP